MLLVAHIFSIKKENLGTTDSFNKLSFEIFDGFITESQVLEASRHKSVYFER